MKKNWADQSYGNGWNKKPGRLERYRVGLKCCLLKSINHGKDMEKII